MVHSFLKLPHFCRKHGCHFTSKPLPSAALKPTVQSALVCSVWLNPEPWAKLLIAPLRLVIKNLQLLPLYLCWPRSCGSAVSRAREPPPGSHRRNLAWALNWWRPDDFGKHWGCWLKGDEGGRAWLPRKSVPGKHCVQMMPDQPSLMIPVCKQLCVFHRELFSPAGQMF